MQRCNIKYELTCMSVAKVKFANGPTVLALVIGSREKSLGKG